MNKEDKELLEKHKDALIQGMSTEDLLDELVHLNVIDNETKEQIEKLATPERRAERLLEAVAESKASNAMQSFLDTLNMTHSFLHDLLKPPRQPDSRPPLAPVPIHQHEPQTSSQRPTSSTMQKTEFDENTVLSNKQLWEISDKLEILEWIHLGRNLDLPEGTLAEIKQNDSASFRESVHQMLLRWKARHFEKCTIGTLCEALQKLKRNDLVKIVRDFASSEEFQKWKDLP